MLVTKLILIIISSFLTRIYYFLFLLLIYWESTVNTMVISKVHHISQLWNEMKPNQAKETKQSVTNAKKESKQSETVAAAWGAMLQKLALITKANALNKTKQNWCEGRGLWPDGYSTDCHKLSPIWKSFWLKLHCTGTFHPREVKVPEVFVTNKKKILLVPL